MAEEEYEDVYDLKKIAIVAVLIIAAGVVSTFVLGIFEIDLPDLKADFQVPEISTPEEQPRTNEEQTRINQEQIRSEYEKYLEFGLSADDIVDIQNIPCESLINATNLSVEPQYDAIWTQKRIECDL